MKLIKLEQPSCPPCAQVSKYLDEKNLVYEKVNVWDHPEVASDYGVMSVPVTILLDDNDNEVARTIGFRPQELDNIISQL